MSGLKHYDFYTADEVVAAFGTNNDARKVCDGQWMLFPNLSVCLATIGEGKSRFNAASKFVWVSSEQSKVHEPTAFVPLEVRGGKAKCAPIFLFAKRSTDSKYRYLGELGPTYAIGPASRNAFGHADFDLTPALPSSILSAFDSLRIIEKDHAGLDATLDQMRGPTNLAQRTDVLKRLVEYWHGPIGSNDGFTEDELTGLHIPTALRAWYLWAGKRREIMSGQNFLLLPKHDRGTYGGLYQKDGRLIFYQENQCVYQWATLEDGDDPPVYGRYDDADPWTEEGISVSEHLILACLFEAILGHCRYGASVAWLREDKVTEIATSISPLAIAPWRWNYPMRFYGRNGAFMYTASNGEAAGEKGMSVWIGAETEHPLQFLRTYLDKGWEYVSV